MDQEWIPIASALVTGVVGAFTIWVGRRMTIADRKNQASLNLERRKITRQNTDADQLWTLYEDLREEAKTTEESLRGEMRNQREEHQRELQKLREEHREEMRQLQLQHRQEIEQITSRYEARIESFIQYIAQTNGQKEARDAADRSYRAGETPRRDSGTSEVPKALPRPPSDA